MLCFRHASHTILSSTKESSLSLTRLMHARLLCLPSQSYLPMFAFSFISAPSSSSSLFLDWWLLLLLFPLFASPFVVRSCLCCSICLTLFNKFTLCTFVSVLLLPVVLSLVLRLYSPLFHSSYFVAHSLCAYLNFWTDIVVKTAPLFHLIDPLICAIVVLSLAEILWCETTMLLVSLTTKFTLNPCSQ